MRKSLNDEGDPFQVDPLPKTFYYPSQQKELPEDQRKICLSPDHRKEHDLKSPADEKFLQQTNRMKIHEIPTRENGTIDPEQSSSSKFDESWPSTERAMVSTPETDTEISGMSKTPSSEGSDLPVQIHSQHSTLARYINHFRHAPPSSRQARDRNYFDSGKGGEFWWLSSSPPTSSTPKEGSTPPDRLLGPSPRPSLSPKLKRSAVRRGTSPASPISKTRSPLSPSKSSLEGLDTKTADLQRRARTLLEKSESTLESSSSEARRPVRKAKEGPPKDRTPREVPSSHAPPGPSIMDHQVRQLQPRPAPPPEEDILYQWRLARKMERAQEQVAKWGPARSTFPPGSLQPRALAGASTVLQTTSRPLASSQMDVTWQRPELHVPAPLVVSGVQSSTTSSLAITQTTSSVRTAVMSDREGTTPQIILPHFGITSQAQGPTSRSQHSQMVTEISSGTHQIIPSTEQSTNTATEEPVVLGHVHKPVIVEWEKFESADVPSHMHLSCDILPCPHQKALIRNGSSDQNIKLPLSSPVVEMMSEELHLEERDTVRGPQSRRSVIRESHDKRHVHGLPRTKQTGSEDGRSKAGPLGSKEVTVTTPEDNERERHRRKEVVKQKPKTKREISQPGHGTTDVLSGVIGQVVSERLFSTPCSSTSSVTGSEEGVEAVMHYHCQASVDENTNPDSSSDNDFPEDEVLKMLRQQAKRYREQLRQIDGILNQQTTGESS